MTRSEDRSPTSDAAKDFLWIKENGPSYEGKWVVLRDGVLLVVGDSYAEVREKAYEAFTLPFLITPIVASYCL